MMEPLSHVLESLKNSKERVTISYSCGSIHTGRVHRIGEVYYLSFNSRSVVATRIDLYSVVRIRYSLSKVVLWQALGSRSIPVKLTQVNKYENINNKRF